MENEKVIIKNYPSPNPNVAKSSSRFAKEVREVNGKEIDVIAAADFEYELTKFELDENERGIFKPITDDKQQVKKGNDTIFPYIPNSDLEELIRLVQILKRPILLKGEPGSGKTQLSKAVAYEWYGSNYRQHYFEWHIKSTSKATDGLYTFDHVGRLRDAHFSKLDGNKTTLKDIKEYRSFGPLAKAFLTSTRESPSIILIDEIDKAGIDFPNDLLLELDEGRFTILETGEEIKALYPPVIFITSNDERQLPEAFLRRCLFSYIQFPENDQLKNIIRAHIPGLVEKHEEFFKNAIDRFNKLREDIKRDAADSKRVSTSELLDWLKAFYYDLMISGKLESEELKNLDFEKLKNYLPTLLKTIPAIKRENSKGN